MRLVQSCLLCICHVLTKANLLVETKTKMQCALVEFHVLQCTRTSRNRIATFECSTFFFVCCVCAAIFKTIQSNIFQYSRKILAVKFFCHQHGFTNTYDVFILLLRVMLFASLLCCRVPAKTVNKLINFYIARAQNPLE